MDAPSLGEGYIISWPWVAPAARGMLVHQRSAHVVGTVIEAGTNTLKVNSEQFGK